MRVAVVSLGCTKNLVDTEVMLGHLHQAGCAIVEDPEDADCLLVNTCAFLTEAVEESLDRIMELAQLKENGGPSRLVVTGCLVSRYGEEILEEIPEVDALVPHKELEKVVEAVKGQDVKDQDTERMNQDADDQILNSQFSILNSKSPFPYRVRSHPEHRAYIKIGEGCSNWCTYCLIPSIRGEFTSRPVPSLLGEMEHLVSQGVREVTLVSQDSGRYGLDHGTEDLSFLLRNLLKVPGDFWLRVLYVHPSRITEELLELVTSDIRMCRYLDVPFQHVSPSILERMGRGEAPRPLDLIQRIRRKIPDVFLRTTLMTGFPGETEKDFQQVLAFVRQAGLDHLGVFTYSREEGTPAARMEGQVPESLARERADRLMAQQATVSAGKLRQLVGREIPVLVEGFDGEGAFGRHQGQAPEVDGVVRLDEDVQPGSFVKVRIIDSGTYDLKGEVLDSDMELPTI